MKRWLFSGVLAAAMAVTGFTLAEAQDQERRMLRGGPGVGRGPGAPGFGLMADLSEEQRKQVQAILQEERAAHEGRAALMAVHRELRTELLADVPDEQKIDELRRKLAEAQTEALTREIEVQRKIAQVLTPEQRAKARERLAQAPTPRGRR
jgi:Spy/CpxP family protein refolding chaperone